MLRQAQVSTAHCTEALTTARAALGEYQSLDASHVIVYTCDETDDEACETECELVASQIGDVSAVRAEAFAESTSFRDESTSTVSRVVAYSTARALYDEQYVANKSAKIRSAVAEAVDSIVSPFVAYVLTTRQARRCIAQALKCELRRVVPGRRHAHELRVDARRRQLYGVSAGRGCEGTV